LNSPPIQRIHLLWLNIINNWIFMQMYVIIW
jgi:hypothetical protein